VARATTPASQFFWKGMQWGAEGSMIGLPLIAMETGMAQRGEMLPTIAARTTGLVTYPAMTGLLAAGLTVFFPELRAAGFIGGVLGMYPDALVQDGLLRGIRTMTASARAVHHLETGGTYQDTELAQRQRMSALTEMSGAVSTGRRYLGQEAALLHR
jgi:hypothetical protein